MKTIVYKFILVMLLTLGVLTIAACSSCNSNMVGEEIETPLYSNEMNNQVYERTLSICSPEQMEKAKEVLFGTFNITGTFLGTAEAQRMIDMSLMGNFKNNALDKFGGGMHITILEQVNEKSTALMNKIRQNEAEEFAKNGFPSVQVMSKRLDDTFNNLEFVTDKQKRIYNKSILAFQKGQSVSQKSNVQKMSDLIAYKAFLIDKAIIEHFIDSYMVWQEGPTAALSNMSKKNYKEMIAEFEETAKPIP